MSLRTGDENQPCDCLVYCGDDPWIKQFRAEPCSTFKKGSSYFKLLMSKEQEARETPERIESVLNQVDGGEEPNSLTDMGWAIVLINRAREAAVDGRKLDADTNLSVAITKLNLARVRLEKE